MGYSILFHGIAVQDGTVGLALWYTAVGCPILCHGTGVQDERVELHVGLLVSGTPWMSHTVPQYKLEQ